MLSYKTILVPTDFSDFSQEALRYALRFAEIYGASLHLVHVVASTFSLDDAQAIQIEKLQDLSKRLADMLPDEEHKLEIHRQVLEGSVSSEIVGYADEHDADLIVMGTHGRTGVTHLLLGSVAEKVIRNATCPELVVRPRLEKVSELPRATPEVSVQTL